MRTLSVLLQAVLGGLEIPARMIARFHMDDAVYGASDSPDTFTWDSQQYLGFDRAFGFDIGSNALSQRPSGGSISLSGTDPAVLEAAFLDDYRARRVEAGFVFADPSTGALSEEFMVLDGRMDNLKEAIQPHDPLKPERPQIATITVGIAPVADQLARAGNRIRSDADQRAYRDPDDGAFKDVGLAGRSEISWGVAGANSPYAANPRG